ncbi:hypothetical protein NtRootA9_13830 [Arthrobacter sp. NtRootA9]|nr:hypothetical protein NtRootA9_13830 [Arthrobacter sp. NtRootA9]
MGRARAPVAPSGSWPAWIWRVSKDQPLDIQGSFDMGPAGTWHRGPRLPSGPLPDGQVLTRGTPPRMEGCRPASRGLALALMTWAKCRNRTTAADSIVTNKVLGAWSSAKPGAAPWRRLQEA